MAVAAGIFRRDLLHGVSMQSKRPTEKLFFRTTTLAYFSSKKVVLLQMHVG
jgi:hypothetical protein